ILLFSVFTHFCEWGVYHHSRLQRKKAKLNEQNFRLQKENEALRQRISRLRHDDSYLEKIAREELNLVRPGEVIYRFSSSEPRNPRAGSLKDPASKSRPSTAQKTDQKPSRR